MTQLLERISSSASGAIDDYGLAALFVSITFETLGLPFPGETALMLASVAAGLGKLNVWSVAGIAFLAAVLGDNIGYLIGRTVGRTLIDKHGRRFGVTPEGYAKAENWAERYSPYMVLIARFVVLLRQLNGLAAGTTGMHWATFLTANIAGAALWVGSWVTIAYKFGHSPTIMPWVWQHIHLFGSAAVFISLTSAGIFFWRLRSGGRGKT